MIYNCCFLQESSSFYILKISALKTFSKKQYKKLVVN